VETTILLREQSAWYALLNVLANNVVGILAAFVGLFLARLLG
jgi:fluoride ion exporter CrcB/FEX